MSYSPLQNDNIEISSYTLENPNFTCEFCLKIYKTKGCLNRHLNYECSLNPNNQKFQCNECNFTTKRRYILKNHKKMHENQEIRRNKLKG